METQLLIIWLIAAVVLGVAEIATVQLVAIWFAIGAVAAMAVCSVGLPLWVQILVFGVVSLILLLLTRPFVKKVLKMRHVNTNADRLIGKIVTVTETIGEREKRGTVKYSGVTWNAVSEDGHIIKKGEEVEIKAIEGSKLIVSKKQS